jgi:NAD+ synthetase
MRVALCQFNPIIGEITGNRRAIAEHVDRAAAARADLAVFGELSLVGYPPRDLLSKDGLVAASVAAVEELATHAITTAALVGFVRPTPDKEGRALQNCAALLADGKVQHVHVKNLLPTYDVFDETRYFEPGPTPTPLEFNGRRIGLSVCEDLWDAEALGRAIYDQDPVDRLCDAGVDILINMAASPFEVHKAGRREELFARRAKRYGVPIAYVNQVGGNDELIFDGGSCLVAADGRVIGRASSFRADQLVVDLPDSGAAPPPGRCEDIGSDMAQLSSALKLGLRDYVHTCGFESVVLGLSGGIDSAVVATLAADALGPENVTCLGMPSRYSSDHSVNDARQLAEALGVVYHEVPIETMHASYEQSLADMLSGGNVGIAEENIQARIRGNIVMAYSNAHGNLALATGNKSELSVGYCTLYGDMCGGLAPIGDVLKTAVYDLARQLNAEAGRECICGRILTKPPSAELKPDQTDQDKLPPYDTLDPILRLYIEEDLTAPAIVERGFDEMLVRKIVRMVDLSEYKRQQAARVLKVSRRAFGMGRRVPIAQKFVH